MQRPQPQRDLASAQRPSERLLQIFTTNSQGCFVKVKFISCTTLAMATGLAFTTAQAEVILAANFEDYSLQGIGMASNGWAITNAVTDSGNYAAMHTLQAVAVKPQPDANLLTTAAVTEHSIGPEGRARSQIAVKGDLERGKNYTIRFSNKVSNPNGNSIIFNIHKRREQSDPNGHQPLSLKVHNGRWLLTIKSLSAKSRRYDLGEIDNSKFTDWELKVKFSAGADGSVQVRKNGIDVVDDRGPNDFGGARGPYVKFGVYRPDPRGRATGGSQTAYYDNVTVSRDEEPLAANRSRNP